MRHGVDKFTAFGDGISDASGAVFAPRVSFFDRVRELGCDLSVGAGCRGGDDVRVDAVADDNHTATSDPESHWWDADLMGGRYPRQRDWGL
ncbi:hypothetical protein QFZ46_003695 [Microbacterium murale]|uniref:Uncharacterized protein n=1 Tax=Microbacterium murale TaxID=1081040 RepID=A0ABU0PE08_9MICO|nr:hypothetical protein [Microbacterium murale]